MIQIGVYTTFCQEEGILKFRGPRMGRWIRRGRIWRFLGRPDFRSRGLKMNVLKGFGTSGRKNRGAQKRQILPRQIQHPILGPLINDTFAKLSQ